MRGKLGKSGLCLLFCVFIIQKTAFACDIEVTKGVMDLRNITDRGSFSYALTGEWEFYPGAFIDATAKHEPLCYATVPSFWNNNTSCNVSMKGTGFASYRCVVILPENYRAPLGFNIPVFNTSYKMWVNGKIIGFNGVTSDKKEKAAPLHNSILARFYPDSDTLDIVIHVSNYHHSKGGFWLPLKIGSYIKVQKGYSVSYILTMATSAMLFFTFVFFFLLFLFKQKNKKALSFSIVSLMLSLSTFFSPPYLITLFGYADYNVITRAEYVVLSFLLTSAVWYIHFIFPSRYTRAAGKILLYILPAIILLILLLPLITLSYSDIIFGVLSALIVIYPFIMSLKGVVKKNIRDTLIFLGFVLMAAGTYSDIILATGNSHEFNMFISPQIMVLFAFIQSALIIKEWVEDSNEKEKLNVKLEELARHLEERVNNRTAELMNKTSEIESQNKQILEQNKKLSDIIRVKDKIFALISHDLRSPVVNILYGLNLIKEEKSAEKKEQLTNVCIQNSQMVINLLENMLVWGRGQEDMIRFSPGNHDLADIILTNMSIYKEYADRKKITLNFTQVGSSRGWFDKDLMDIVIRNLISNAIKFTRHDGRVSIFLREGEKSGDCLTLKVIDNGVGITEEKLETLFTGKNIQSTMGTDNEKGTGIGLTLVYELIKICQGTITADSAPGEGTCFTIELPFAMKKTRTLHTADKPGVN